MRGTDHLVGDRPGVRLALLERSGPADCRSVYDLHDDAYSWVDSVVTYWRWLTEPQKLWRIVESGDVVGTYNFKVNSGASAVVNRVTAAASTSGKINQLSTNIAVPSITAGNSTLYFLPDRTVIRDGKRYSDIDAGRPARRP
jgi:DNA polymerase-3 subunit epsilon